MRLGDAVKAVTDTLGIEQCDECRERQVRWNDFGAKLKAALTGGTIHEQQQGERAHVEPSGVPPTTGGGESARGEPGAVVEDSGDGQGSSV